MKDISTERRRVHDLGLGVGFQAGEKHEQGSIQVSLKCLNGYLGKPYVNISGYITMNWMLI